MLVGVAVLAVIAPAAEPGDNRADAAPAAQSAADASAPRFALEPIAGAPVTPPATALSATDPTGLARSAPLGVSRFPVRTTGSRLSTRSRARSAASRSATRTPVRPPLVAQRFTHNAAAKRSALAQTAKLRPRPRHLATGADRAARGGRPGTRHAGRSGSHGSGRWDSDGSGFGGGGRMSAVIAYAWAQVGKPYVLGTDGPGAFDCSGLTMQAYRRAGIMLPHSSGGQASMARTVSRAEARPGDLVVGPGHIGIYLGDGMMIDAGNSRVGVVYRKVYDGLHIERL